MRNKVLTLAADDLWVIQWYVDAAFAVHKDFKSHTGAAMTYGTGAVQNISHKQKINTKSSTDAELIAADDVSIMILWTKLFLDVQGYNMERNILYQDNKSTIHLETNGHKSMGKRSRALNVWYIFLTNQVNQGNLSINYCLTNDMWRDFHSKPLQGKCFQDFWSKIMGKS